MSASNSFETSLLNHVFNNAAIANIGDAAGLPAAATAGNLFVSLHTADPGEAGDQSTSEAAYTGYARRPVARSGAGWTVVGNSASNAAIITFGTCTAGSAVVTHFGIGTVVSGAGTLLFSGAFASSLTIGVNSTPEIAIGALTTTGD
jgi:nucleoside phosphorylase